MTVRHEVCRVDELPPGERTIVEVNGLSIGVFNIDGEYYAVANVCPHQLAPLCEGRITGDVVSDAVGEFSVERDGEILQCPWHGWKFDIKDGSSVFNPHKIRAPTFEVVVESSDDEGDSPEAEQPSAQEITYGTELKGKEPPVDTYQVEVEADVVVVYV